MNTYTQHNYEETIRNLKGLCEQYRFFIYKHMPMDLFIKTFGVEAYKELQKILEEHTYRIGPCYGQSFKIKSPKIIGEDTKVIKEINI